MTVDPGNISLLCPHFLRSHSSVIVGNGSTLPMTAIGDVVLPRSFCLNIMLIAPHIIKNLISVHKFTIDNNCSIEFAPFGLSMKGAIALNPSTPWSLWRLSHLHVFFLLLLQPLSGIGILRTMDMKPYPSDLVCLQFHVPILLVNTFVRLANLAIILDYLSPLHHIVLPITLI